MSKKKKVTTYKEFVLQLHELALKLPKGPFQGISIDDNGCLILNEDYLQPEEARRLGKFITDFYGGED